MAEGPSGEHRHPHHSAPASISAQYYPEDEISLFDLWDVLVRRWRWVAGILLVSVLLGLAYVLMRAPVYAWSQTIEIGSWLVIERTNRIEPAEMVEEKDGARFVDTVLRSLESPEVVAAKAEERHVPAGIAAWRDVRPAPRWQPNVTAEADPDAGTVVIMGEGTAERGDDWKRILADVTDRLQSAHAGLLAAIRQRLEVELMQARNQLDDIEQEKRVRESRLQRLDRHEALIADRIALHERLLDEAERRRALLRDSNPGEAMGLILLAEEMRAARERLGDLRVQLQVELPQRRETLESEIAALERRMETQRGEIEARRLQMESVSPTRALSEPRRSGDPVGTGASVIMALSLVLGGMLGVFAAFFAEFVQAANRRRDAGGAEGEIGS